MKKKIEKTNMLEKKEGRLDALTKERRGIRKEGKRRMKED